MHAGRKTEWLSPEFRGNTTITDTLSHETSSRKLTVDCLCSGTAVDLVNAVLPEAVFLADTAIRRRLEPAVLTCSSAVQMLNVVLANVHSA